MSEEIEKAVFNEDLIRKYPRANKKLTLDVSEYGISDELEDRGKIITEFISPYGVQFKSTEKYEKGTLLKLQIALPDYWSRKQRFVNYGRVDNPGEFKILAKVVSTEKVGKRGKKQTILCRTVNMDQIDEEVLKAFLKDG